MIKRQYYGWLDAGTGKFRISLYPADAPVRPSVELNSIEEVNALIKQKRATIHWWPPLPDHLQSQAA